MLKHLSAAVLALLVLATPARADWLLTPYLGLTFEGNAPSEQLNYGLSFAFLGGGIFGVEFDAAVTPSFFNDGDYTLDIDDSNVSTVMGNLIVSIPAPLRPYASGGVGLVRIGATSVGNVFDVSDNSFGMNIGAGLMGQFSDHVGLRGDIRYFRSFQDTDLDEDADFDLDLGGFDFWRGTLGLTFRW